MRPAFIIMQIGNEELDRVAASAIVPALSAVGFDAKRVDKHNKGELLKSEIINFIRESDLIVADLTNERPNCYLEVGFVMGASKFANLILTVREDHFPDSLNHKVGGPKVHFDLAGYDILAWRADDLDSFRLELEKRVRRRLELIDSESNARNRPASSDESYWHLVQRDAAAEGIKKTRFRAFMEVTFAPASRIADVSLPKLNNAARAARIQTFGWPIAPYIDKDEFRPRPTNHGIVAEIATDDELGRSYDYWALRTNGEFYCCGSLFEDERASNKIFFDTRMVRVTEVFLYCKRLYSELGFNPEHVVSVHVRHAGLKGRTLAAANSGRWLRGTASSIEDQSEVGLNVRLDWIDSELPQLVKKVLEPLFALFDFFEFEDAVYQEIVEKFARGEI